MSRRPLSTDDLGFFFEEKHHALAARLAQVGDAHEAPSHDAAAVARALGEAHGLYALLVPERHGGAPVGRPADDTFVDVRSLCLVRELLGQVSALADSIFAVQGLGSYPVVLAGSEAQKARVLPDVVRGARIGAFALTEPEAGSDVASLQTVATKTATGWKLDGVKTFISNVGIAQHYVVFANADPSQGRRGITAFLVEKGTPGLHEEPLALSAEHPLGQVVLAGCEVGDDGLLGRVGDGFKLAMRTLDTFRVTVGAAAVGMARRALAETGQRVSARRQFGKLLVEQPVVQAKLADMATDLDAARLLVYRAAHTKDHGARSAGTEVAMAKLFATEAAARIIDEAVQLHGGSGVLADAVVERLAREARPLRIYEGTSEIQRLIIGSALGKLFSSSEV